MLTTLLTVDCAGLPRHRDKKINDASCFRNQIFSSVKLNTQGFNAPEDTAAESGKDGLDAIQGMNASILLGWNPFPVLPTVVFTHLHQIGQITLEMRIILQTWSRHDSTSLATPRYCSHFVKIERSRLNSASALRTKAVWSVRRLSYTMKCIFELSTYLNRSTDASGPPCPFQQHRAPSLKTNTSRGSAGAEMTYWRPKQITSPVCSRGSGSRAKNFTAFISG